MLCFNGGERPQDYAEAYIPQRWVELAEQALDFCQSDESILLWVKFFDHLIDDLKEVFLATVRT